MNITLKVKVKDTKDGWEGSPLNPLEKTDNQKKGTYGTLIVKQILESRGITCKVVSDRGDLETSKGRSEVKCGFASYSSKYSEEFWWNQVRPKQDGWDYLHLVGIARDRIMVWELTKGQFMSLGSIVGDGHVEGDGAGTLKEIKIVKNSRRDTISLLDDYLIATIPASDVTLM